MIHPLVLGNKNFPLNLIQGPLAGISCAPFRRLIWKYSQPAFTCTEMISCKTLIHHSISSHRRFVYKDPAESAVCFQLAGNNAEDIAEAVKIATDYGADLIDLNCGCPVKKIRSKRAGSFLLSEATKLYQLIVAMKKNTSLPVSIKIRVDGASGENFNKDVVLAINESGCDFLVVHGRHWNEHYETPCRYDEIKFFVENTSIPVIGNGDISCFLTLKKMFSTGCAGAMIGRAGVGQPWLIHQLIAKARQENFIAPSLKKILGIFFEHVFHLTLLLGNEKFAIIQARKLAKYYMRNLPEKNEFCNAINNCNNLSEFEKICVSFSNHPGLP